VDRINSAVFETPKPFNFPRVDLPEHFRREKKPHKKIMVAMEDATPAGMRAMKEKAKKNSHRLF
jgi:hypothetical protein